MPSGVLVSGTSVEVGSRASVGLVVIVGVAVGVSLGRTGVELASCELCSSPPRGVGVRIAEGIGTGDRVNVVVGLPPPPNT